MKKRTATLFNKGSTIIAICFIGFALMIVSQDNATATTGAADLVIANANTQDAAGPNFTLAAAAQDLASAQGFGSISEKGNADMLGANESTDTRIADSSVGAIIVVDNALPAENTEIEVVTISADTHRKGMLDANVNTTTIENLAGDAVAPSYHGEIAAFVSHSGDAVEVVLKYPLAGLVIGLHKSTVGIGVPYHPMYG